MPGSEEHGEAKQETATQKGKRKPPESNSEAA
jgi:hypothetical protein